MSDLKERDIEAYLCRRVKELGGETRKVKWLGRDGAPDRIVILGGLWPVELKAPGEKPKPHQVREHERLAKHDVPVFVIDSFDQVEEFLWFIRR